MKKEIVIGIFIVLISMSFVSAGWFSDLFGKTTGEVVGDNFIFN